MTTEIQTTGSRDLARVAESLVTKGDLSGLTPEERARHYIATCESHGLNPHSQPFSFLTLNGKLVMYANRGASDQLASMHHVNRKIIRGPEEFTLITWDTNRKDHLGKWVLGYRLTLHEWNRKACVVFDGEDFACSPQHAVDSDAAIEGIMGFLCLRKGDTDPESDQGKPIR
jgi:hypothetical protein